MPNPFFSNRVTPNGSTQPSEPVNEAHKKYSRGYSTFDLSVPHYMSARYADLTPHEVFECVEGDRIEISNSHNIRSDAFVGPFLNDVTMRKSYFAVDYRAFLPNSWKHIYPLSIDGDDIPSVEVNTVLPDFHARLWSLIRAIRTIFENSAVSADGFNILNYGQRFHHLGTFLFKMILFFECFFSEGSLLRYLRSNFYRHFKANVAENFEANSLFRSFDNFLQQFFSVFIQNNTPSSWMYLSYTLNDKVYRYAYITTLSMNVVPADYVAVGFREFIDIIREHPDCDLTIGFDNFGSRLKDFYYSIDVSNSEYADGKGLNFSRVCAYQLIFAQFFTNDKIDFVQSSKDYLDNMKTIIKDYVRDSSLIDFINSQPYYGSYVMNGIDVEYDVLSGYQLTYMIDRFCGYIRSISADSLTIDDYLWGLPHMFNYVMNLFTFRKNLRYGDYFTGARARALAVGDVSTPVVGNAVSTLDSTRNLLLQRFRNAVNRVGDRLQDYVEGVLGGQSAPDVEIPRFLATITSSFNGYEVENTSDSQGKIVTVVNSRDGKYVYTMEAGEPCIVIGLTSFMSQRVYAGASDRFFFHEDRFDMFNPFYQYAGDQPIYQAERNGRLGFSPFAYTLRHMEYKQRLPMAVGAFISNLPGMAFVTDNVEGDGLNVDYVDNENLVVISPDYIRANNGEFDRFYPSLTGLTLSNYYHFYIRMDNHLIAHRRMEYSPSML